MGSRGGERRPGLTRQSGPLFYSLLRDRRGDAIIEYVLVMAVITVGIACALSPGSTTGFALYDAVRAAYRRAVVVISVPLL